MIARIELQPAYVLHCRPYRDTSVIADLMTEAHGRVPVVARGVRGNRRRSGSRLPMFAPLLISCRGRGELKTLTDSEITGRTLFFTGKILFSVLYINELLIRLLPVHDAYPQLFHLYEKLLLDIEQDEMLEASLRKFEFSLLRELGYEVPLVIDAVSGESIQPDTVYRFDPTDGFVACAQVVSEDFPEYCFLGRELLGIAADHYQEDAVRKAAKRLTRLAIRPHLGERPLKSRELFAKLALR